MQLFELNYTFKFFISHQIIHTIITNSIKITKPNLSILILINRDRSNISYFLTLINKCIIIKNSTIISNEEVKKKYYACVIENKGKWRQYCKLE